MWRFSGRRKMLRTLMVWHGAGIRKYVFQPQKEPCPKTVPVCKSSRQTLPWSWLHTWHTSFFRLDPRRNSHGKTRGLFGGAKVPTGCYPPVMSGLWSLTPIYFVWCICICIYVYKPPKTSSSRTHQNHLPAARRKRLAAPAAPPLRHKLSNSGWGQWIQSFGPLWLFLTLSWSIEIDGPKGSLFEDLRVIFLTIESKRNSRLEGPRPFSFLFFWGHVLCSKFQSSPNFSGNSELWRSAENWDCCTSPKDRAWWAQPIRKILFTGGSSSCFFVCFGGLGNEDILELVATFKKRRNWTFKKTYTSLFQDPQTMRTPRTWQSPSGCEVATNEEVHSFGNLHMDVYI